MPREVAWPSPGPSPRARRGSSEDGRIERTVSVAISNPQLRGNRKAAKISWALVKVATSTSTKHQSEHPHGQQRAFRPLLRG